MVGSIPQPPTRATGGNKGKKTEGNLQTLGLERIEE
jgi:hypothetical protein